MEQGSDSHLLIACRYVEANPVRAGLTRRAADWRWCSLMRRLRGGQEDRQLLAALPVPAAPAAPGGLSDVQLAALRACLIRGRPFGSEVWQARAARRLGLEHMFRPRGRPRKHPGEP